MVAARGKWRRIGVGTGAMMALAIVAAGCGDLRYDGTAPSLRTYADEPLLSQYIVGADASFVIVAEGDQHRTGRSDGKTEVAPSEVPGRNDVVVPSGARPR